MTQQKRILMKKTSIMLLLIAVAVCLLALPASAETIEDWNPDSPALASITAYVEADTDYTFQSSDRIVFDGNYYGENAKTSKVDAIVREIGQQPVLAFGNSSGDLAMAVYTISGNPYRSAAYIVLADDAVREYGNAESAAQSAAVYQELGLGVISMRDDFETIYGDGVVKAE